MAAGRLIWPLIEPVLDATGQVVAGAVLKVFANRTTTLVTVYADLAMTTPVANPQTGLYASNAAGRFFAQTHVFWVPQGALYTMRLERPDGSFDVIDDIQPQGSEISGVPTGGMMVPHGQLVLSNNATSPGVQISVSVGACRDSTNSVDLLLASPITKRIDQSWSAGTGNGLRDAGTLGASQTWHIFLIDGPNVSTDVLGSTSPTSPLLPAGYTNFRRLGAILTDGSSVIRPFVQFGDYFELAVRTTDFAAQTNGGNVPFLRSTSAPKGIKVEAYWYYIIAGTADTNAYLTGGFDPDHGVPPAFGPSTQWAWIRSGGFKDTTGSNVRSGGGVYRASTDANGKLYTMSSDPAELMTLGLIGWWDRR